MILASHQPDFLPYMGFFYKAANCDMLVFSDDVQFSKKGMHNWNRIKTPGGAQKLTVPVHAHHDTPLKDVMVVDLWHDYDRLAKTIRQHYSRAPYQDEGEFILTMLGILAEKKSISLAEMNIAINKSLMELFGIDPLIKVASKDLHLSGHKDERIFHMCDELGADVYLSGTGASSYHQAEEYLLRGIDLVYSDYRPTEYPQLYGTFVPNLSVLDYVFNCGFKLPAEWEERP